MLLRLMANLLRSKDGDLGAYGSGFLNNKLNHQNMKYLQASLYLCDCDYQSSKPDVSVIVAEQTSNV